MKGLFYSFVLVSALFLTGCGFDFETLGADAGVDQTVESGKKVVLDGSKSTGTAGKTLIYHWKQIKGTTVKLAKENTVHATFMAPNKKSVLLFKLTVTEKGTFKKTSDLVKIFVKKPTDNVKPIITLNGDVNIIVEQNAEYNDAGASATDNKDGDITKNIKVVNPVDTTKIGTYLVTYSVTDKAGNKADTVSRTVEVVQGEDTVAPVITLNGDTRVTVVQGSNYADAGAIAVDDRDGDITANITIAGVVDTTKTGTYTVTYNVSDAAGNAADEISRTVTVVSKPDPILEEDTTPPVISLKGKKSITLKYGETYNDAGATAKDNVDGDITEKLTTVGTVDTTKVGTYTLTYSVSDAAGNEAEKVTRTVNVVDTTKPVITLAGDSKITIIKGNEYTDAGATATDNVDGDITANITISGAVDTTKTGTYTVTYNVSDKAGNAADEISRIVTVVLEADKTIPVITLKGEETVTIEAGQTYKDAGATATDNVDGDITDNVKNDANKVDTTKVGTYTVTYTVSDAAGNEAEKVTRTVNVVDTTKPVITITGDNPITVAYGSTYEDLGATAKDAVDGDLEVNRSGTVDTQTVGTYTITYTATDKSNNSATKTRTVHVKDLTKPVITLKGVNPMTIDYGSKFSDPGATANDNIDADLTNAIKASNNVDTNKIGTYTVTYTVSDAAGNEAKKERTVNVTDQTIPVITLKGEETVTIEAGQTYKDAGATATDNVDGDISKNIKNNADKVNTKKVGTYTVTYSVSDAAGNEAKATRTVKVVDTVKPVITIKGDNPITVAHGSSYEDLGATAKDAVDGDLEVSQSGTVDTNKIGSYTITYTVSDAAGNEAKKERTVKVTDQTIPVITLKGEKTVTIEAGEIYKDAGATATDNVDGDITNNVNNDASKVDTTKVGTYTVTYSVSDAAGNEAEKVTRTVTVKDLTKPVITLNGASKVEVEEGKPYTDLGATAIDNVDGELSVVTSGQVDTSTPGSYEMTYTATDKAGNSAIAKRVVIVKKLYYTIDVPLDSNCKGHITKSGKDTNGNGKLDKDEVTETSEPVYDDTRERITRENLRKMIINGEDVTNINTCDIMDMSFLVSLNNGQRTEDDLTDNQKNNIKTFNQDISRWNVGGVTSMEGMFYKAYAFNQNINDWNVSNVTTMFGMFAGDVDTSSQIPKLVKATNFNQPLNNWNVSNVTNMKGMFGGDVKFNQNINDWNVSNVTTMYGMFGLSEAFNQPLNNWDVSSVENMGGMFGFTKHFNQSLDQWNVSNVENMEAMFVYAEAFSGKDLSGWNVKKVAKHDYFIWGAGEKNIEPKWNN